LRRFVSPATTGARVLGWVQLMVIIENGRQPRDARANVQAWRITVRCSILIFLISVGGCANYHTSGPEAWWHEAVGGKIAEQRPPPPGDKDPYPNLATVPAKPAAANTTTWTQMTAGLTTDRLNALQAAALAPIPTSPAPAPTSPTPIVGQQEPGASASLVGASPSQAAPTQSATPKARPPQAGQSPGQSQAGTPPAATGSPQFLAVPSTIPVPTPAVTGAAQRVANGQLPALPIDEPARPGIAPPPRPPAVPMTATLPVATPSLGIVIDFDRGSAALLDRALTDVKTIAGIRGDDGIAITGYGDAISSDAGAQSNAVALGLSRASALATALVAQGVPYARLRLNAEAAGRGATLRLLE